MPLSATAHPASSPRGQYDSRGEDQNHSAPRLEDWQASTEALHIQKEIVRLKKKATLTGPGTDQSEVAPPKEPINMAASDCNKPPDLTSGSPPARPSVRFRTCSTADPNRRWSASRRLSEQQDSPRGARPSAACTPLSGEGVVAAASARRTSWVGLTRQLSEVTDQVGQPARVLTSARVAASMERTREPTVGADGLWLGPNAVHLLRWCLLLVVGINVLAFPFLLSFVGPVSRSTNHAWFAVLLACDVVLWLDVASRFVTPQWEGGDEGEETRLSHRRVASRYLLSWDGLLLDVLCRWPWDAFMAAAAGAPPWPQPSCLLTWPYTFAPLLGAPLAPRPSPLAPRLSPLASPL